MQGGNLSLSPSLPLPPSLLVFLFVCTRETDRWSWTLCTGATARFVGVWQGMGWEVGDHSIPVCDKLLPARDRQMDSCVVECPAPWAGLLQLFWNLAENSMNFVRIQNFVLLSRGTPRACKCGCFIVRPVAWGWSALRGAMTPRAFLPWDTGQQPLQLSVSLPVMCCVCGKAQGSLAPLVSSDFPRLIWFPIDLMFFRVIAANF